MLCTPHERPSPLKSHRTVCQDICNADNASNCILCTLSLCCTRSLCTLFRSVLLFFYSGLEASHGLWDSYLITYRLSAGKFSGAVVCVFTARWWEAGSEGSQAANPLIYVFCFTLLSHHSILLLRDLLECYVVVVHGSTLHSFVLMWSLTVFLCGHKGHCRQNICALYQFGQKIS